MPITQDRMHQLALAGQTYMEAWRLLRNQLKELIYQRSLEHMDHEQFEEGVKDAVFRFELPEDTNSEIIGREIHHYRLTAAKNDRAKAHMQRHRDQQVLGYISGPRGRRSSPNPDHNVQAQIQQALRRHKEIMEADDETPTRGMDPVEAWEQDHGAPSPEQIIDLGDEEPPV